MQATRTAAAAPMAPAPLPGLRGGTPARGATPSAWEPESGPPSARVGEVRGFSSRAREASSCTGEVRSSLGLFSWPASLPGLALSPRSLTAKAAKATRPQALSLRRTCRRCCSFPPRHHHTTPACRREGPALGATPWGGVGALTGRPVAWPRSPVLLTGLLPGAAACGPPGPGRVSCGGEAWSRRSCVPRRGQRAGGGFPGRERGAMRYTWSGGMSRFRGFRASVLLHCAAICRGSPRWWRMMRREGEWGTGKTTGGCCSFR